MTKFVFDASIFVRPGHETDPGEYSDETRAEIAKLRVLYPELAHWGDLALGGAFGEMSSVDAPTNASGNLGMIARRSDAAICPAS
ncbi:hypothetical protein [Sphingopyxis sp. 113P3]|uniref:hypothetical protein n=1 Tax=Sphingopyxis sp. (strain 113P3) TaxID=292913 RepID=UPI0006AD37F8|nr:hypothetical protein [Sphingopyxis sp. 113P3]ALC13717.1 hypothetical protein LH20_17290 [Sphingopyxis sp. 113P3]